MLFVVFDDASLQVGDAHTQKGTKTLISTAHEERNPAYNQVSWGHIFAHLSLVVIKTELTL